MADVGRAVDNGDPRRYSICATPLAGVSEVVSGRFPWIPGCSSWIGKLEARTTCRHDPDHAMAWMSDDLVHVVYIWHPVN